uniref:SPX domain-containing protein n=1 Tax=Palpitomonas bilix TaxID=652834 RepID=A0A7S3GFG7_9EUKA|mmetsp:Transcript_47199/g.121997  ORF Transcript_47199/g.121997 Transcript_47199/m.121997 type:complete len:875 (+) Transcript_47199:150-2774(+)|eukprot:CAMPEP_0113880852 /NCGR_PEP_ID=MMETSP0780_2-20120614/8030_1 /TAXON_ID=652834 /ORGANISM="Palpitomonas bilix" /LENGTH=874 /DNA_ID=CAMNT_0000867603 /DNA_START=81 /DNA_END=2705 /DNA_ORIENTATION=- /assembly_acc=CAM_ASM_000599
MKFGEKLLDERYGPIKHEYVDYELLKKALKAGVKDKARNFSELLMGELRKCDSFYSDEMERIRAKVNEMEGYEAVDATELAIVCEEIDCLRRFVILNTVAIIKIVKKRNKVFGREGIAKIDALKILLDGAFFSGLGLASLLSQFDSVVDKLFESWRMKKQLKLCGICLDLMKNPTVVTLRSDSSDSEEARDSRQAAAKGSGAGHSMMIHNSQSRYGRSMQRQTIELLSKSYTGGASGILHSKFCWRCLTMFILSTGHISSEGAVGTRNEMEMANEEDARPLKNLPFGDDMMIDVNTLEADTSLAKFLAEHVSTDEVVLRLSEKGSMMRRSTGPNLNEVKRHQATSDLTALARSEGVGGSSVGGDSERMAVPSLDDFHPLSGAPLKGSITMSSTASDSKKSGTTLLRTSGGSDNTRHLRRTSMGGLATDIGAQPVAEDEDELTLEMEARVDNRLQQRREWKSKINELHIGAISLGEDGDEGFSYSPGQGEEVDSPFGSLARTPSTGGEFGLSMRDLFETERYVEAASIDEVGSGGGSQSASLSGRSIDMKRGGGGAARSIRSPQRDGGSSSGGKGKRYRRKVLFVGCDDCQSHSIRFARTRNIDWLASNGASCFDIAPPHVPDFFHPSSSQPQSSSFVSISDRIFNVLKKKLPAVRTSFICATSRDAKNTFKPKADLLDEFLNSLEGELPSRQDKVAPKDEYFSRSLSMACEALRSEPETCPDVLAVHVRSVALTSLRHGGDLSTKEYVRSIETMDSQVGSLLQSIAKREQRFAEDWLVILISCHPDQLWLEEEKELAMRAGFHPRQKERAREEEISLQSFAFDSDGGGNKKEFFVASGKHVPFGELPSIPKSKGNVSGCGVEAMRTILDHFSFF